MNDAMLEENPYGVPISRGGWAGNGGGVGWATTNCYRSGLFTFATREPGGLVDFAYFRINGEADAVQDTRSGTPRNGTATPRAGVSHEGLEPSSAP